MSEHELLLLTALTEARLKIESSARDLEAAVERERALVAQIKELDIALAEAGFRTEAVQIVLSAVLACTGWFGLNRRRFRRMVSDAGRTIPDDGPASVQHGVLLSEARKVLEIPDYSV